MFEPLLVHWVPSAALLLMGILYLLWVPALTQEKGETGSNLEMDKSAMAFVSFAGGGFAMLIGVLNAGWGNGPRFGPVMLAFLGFVLIAKALQGVPWAAMIALAVASFAAFGLYNIAGQWLPWWAFLVAGFIVFGIVFGLLFLVEQIFKVFSWFFSFRPILMIMGAVALAEGTLGLFGASLSQFG